MEKKYFFDKPKNLKLFLRGFYMTLFLLIAVDLLISKRPYFAWEEYPSFYGAFGLVACIFLVIVAKYILRPIVKRRENYYD